MHKIFNLTLLDFRSKIAEQMQRYCIENFAKLFTDAPTKKIREMEIKKLYLNLFHIQTYK